MNNENSKNSEEKEVLGFDQAFEQEEPLTADNDGDLDGDDELDDEEIPSRDINDDLSFEDDDDDDEDDYQQSFE